MATTRLPTLRRFSAGAVTQARNYGLVVLVLGLGVCSKAEFPAWGLKIFDWSFKDSPLAQVVSTLLLSTTSSSRKTTASSLRTMRRARRLEGEASTEVLSATPRAFFLYKRSGFAVEGGSSIFRIHGSSVQIPQKDPERSREL